MLTRSQVRVLRGIPAIETKNVIIGQYTKSLDGSKPGYKEDDTVPKESRCPTFCAMVAYIKNERWDGVPFMLKAGKGESTTTCHYVGMAWRQKERLIGAAVQH